MDEPKEGEKQNASMGLSGSKTVVGGAPNNEKFYGVHIPNCSEDGKYFVGMFCFESHVCVLLDPLVAFHLLWFWLLFSLFFLSSVPVVYTEGYFIIWLHILSDFLHVYDDKLEALKVVKHHKKARFKAFKLRSDAVAFAVHGSEISEDGSSSVSNVTSSHSDAEKPSPFKGPKPQDMVQLRRAIESGNLDVVSKTVWENPRFLISSGDTPSILQVMMQSLDNFPFTYLPPTYF